MSNSRRSVARRGTIEGAQQAAAGLYQASMTGKVAPGKCEALHVNLAVLESHDSRVQHPTLQSMNRHLAQGSMQALG